MKTNFRFILYLAVCLFCLASCRNFKEVECTGVKGFKINKVNAQGIDAELLLGVKNPNATGFSIYPSTFDVTYSGIYLGKARLRKRVHISAGSESTYSFNLKSEFKNISLGDIMKLVSGGGSRNTIEVKGNLKAGKFYFRKKFPVNVKERP